MTNGDFEQYLAARNDGFWELLATAVGHRDSVKKSLDGIRASALQAGVGGLAGTPSLVQMRVEALAAYEPEVLLEVSREWTKPYQMSCDIMDGRNDLQMGAWISAMRSLVKLGALSSEHLETKLVGISDEAKACFGQTSFQWHSWSDFKEALFSARIRYADIRALDGKELTLPQLDAPELQELLTFGNDGSPRFERMRIFRGRHEKLSASAVAFLCDALPAETNTNATCLADAGYCVAVETAIPFSSALQSELRSRVMAELSSGRHPEELATISYVLLQKGWTTP